MKIKKLKNFLLPFFLLSTSVFVSSCSSTNSFDVIEQMISNKTLLKQIKTNNNEIVSEGTVLLKNDNYLLPLDKEKVKISAFSINNYDLNLTNFWNTGGNLIDEMEKYGFQINPTLNNIYKNRDRKYISEWQHKNGWNAEKYNAVVNEMPISEIIKNSNVEESFKEYNTAMFTITRGSGESFDLKQSYLELTTEERDVLTYLNNNFKDIIVIINSSNQMPLGWINEFKNIKAVLNVGIIGHFGANSIPKILSGEINPSGRLVNTYSYDFLSAPNNINYANTFDNVEPKFSPNLETVPEQFKKYYMYLKKNVFSKYTVYQEGIYVGYKYYETRYYDKIINRKNVGNYDYNSLVQYPVGHGLSYTDFEYSNFSFDPDDSDNNPNTIDISINVKNVGNYEGKDSVILYLSKPFTNYDIANGIEKPSIEIIDYNKTKILKPNEQQKLTYHVDKSNFKVYDKQKAKTYIDEPGSYYFSIGDNVHDALNNMIKRENINANVSGNENYSIEYKHQTKNINTWKIDDVTYSKNSKGEKITNLFDNVDFRYYYPEFKYLTRNNWVDTFPTLNSSKFNANEKLINDLKKEGLEYDGLLSDAKIKELNNTSKNDDKNLLDKIQFWTKSGDRDYFNRELEFNFSYADGSQGVEIKFRRLGPGVNLLAQTLNKDLQKDFGRLNGNIVSEYGINYWCGPSINIHRNYLNGRNYEYSSEDNIITSMNAININNGFKETSNGSLSIIKHFVLNENETYRFGIQTYIDEQTFREQYLSIAEKLISNSTVGGIMGSQNRIGTTWSSANYNLINSYVKKEIGYNGLILTDAWESGHGYKQQKIVSIIENNMVDTILVLMDKSIGERLYNVVKNDQNLIVAFNAVYESLLEKYRKLPNYKKNFWDKII